MTTAQQLMDLIIAELAAGGVPWQRSNADGHKIGDPGLTVTGVAVTFQPSLAVLERAAERGLNFVVSHEAVFWEGYDAPLLANDPLRKAKEAFIRDNDMVIFRLHDHMHRMQPEPIFTGLLRKLGWAESHTSGQRLDHMEIPEMRLDELVDLLSERLETPNISVVGDPAMPVRSVGWGIHVLSTVLPALHASDVAIVGETAEYDTFEYVRDALALGERKAVIRIAHERLEEWGIDVFGSWLAALDHGLLVEWIPTGDPFTVAD